MGWDGAFGVLPVFVDYPRRCVRMKMKKRPSAAKAKARRAQKVARRQMRKHRK
jgi:hypothetical protein